jgi:hypothetical protein
VNIAKLDEQKEGKWALHKPAGLWLWNWSGSWVRSMGWIWILSSSTYQTRILSSSQSFLSFFLSNISSLLKNNQAHKHEHIHNNFTLTRFERTTKKNKRT